jgi:hypothetical protein
MKRELEVFVKIVIGAILFVASLFTIVIFQAPIWPQ